MLYRSLALPPLSSPRKRRQRQTSYTGIGVLLGTDLLLDCAYTHNENKHCYNLFVANRHF